MLKTKRLYVLLVLMLAACTSATETTVPTAMQAAPTQPAQPTPTEAPQFTPTPDYVISPLTAEQVSQLAVVEGRVFWNYERTAFMSEGSNGSSLLIWEPGLAEPAFILESPDPDAELLVWWSDWSRDGKYVAAYPGWFVSPGLIYIWELAGENTVDILEHTVSVNGIVFSPDGQQLVGIDGNWGVFIKTMNEETVTPFLEPIGMHHIRLIFSPDGSMLARINTGRSSSSVRIDGTVRIHNAEDGAIIATLIGHTEYVSQAVWSPNSEFLVTIEDSWEMPNSQTRVWNVSTQTMEANLPVSGQNFAAWSPDGGMLVTAGNDNINFWAAQDWQPILNLELARQINWAPAFGFEVSGSQIRWSPDGSLIAFIEDGSIRLLDATTLADVASLNDETFASFAWSPNGAVMASGTTDGRLQILDTADWSVLHELQIAEKFVTFLGWSQDGRILSATTYSEAEGERTSIWGISP